MGVRIGVKNNSNRITASQNLPHKKYDPIVARSLIIGHHPHATNYLLIIPT